ncbi:MAG: hypothetical protein H6R15_3171 [Proteobacteria bacterium]|nr:hypothetical protein [Pseudomonadota bacterium]
MITFAWFFAVAGGLLACLLLSMESVGRKMPAWLPLKRYIWWLSVLVFLVSVLTIIFANI